jgi:hypothetical protein
MIRANSAAQDRGALIPGVVCMRRHDDAVLIPDERFRELASIFAGAVLRLQARAALSADAPIPKNLQDSDPNCLELSRETVLSVHGG